MVSLGAHLPGGLPQLRLARVVPQPVVAIVTVAIGLSFLLSAWVRDVLPDPGNSSTIMLTVLGLMAAIVVAYRYPIHVQVHTKVLLITVAYYLLAVLATPALAGLTAGLATLGGEL